MLRAIENTEIITANKLKELDSNHSKLYILGHRASGLGYLSTTLKKGLFSLHAVAIALKGKLSIGYQDIRMSFCYSVNRAGSFWIYKAPAQILANELKKQGFNRVTVTEYLAANYTFLVSAHAERRGWRVFGLTRGRRSLYSRHYQIEREIVQQACEPILSVSKSRS